MSTLKAPGSSLVSEEDGRPVKSELTADWFTEWIDISCGGQAFSVNVKDVLYHEKSIYQDILIFSSSSYGNVLVLDGIINCTERDESSYQEMMTHLALCSHPNPQSVLIVGGGDGGVAREAAKHACVTKIVQCEIDEMVVEACKKYIPSMSKGFESAKVKLVIGDGFEFIKEHHEEFDVIITDSSDPIGPAECLFSKDYYQLLYNALKPNGILSSQGESMWIPMAVEYITRLVTDLEDIFPVVKYAQTYTPSYTTGQIGVVLASKNKDTVFDVPVRVLSESDKTDMNLLYYNEDIHTASFQLPTFIRQLFQKKK